jgi:hypothetical protein
MAMAKSVKFIKFMKIKKCKKFGESEIKQERELTD